MKRGLTIYTLVHIFSIYSTMRVPARGRTLALLVPATDFSTLGVLENTSWYIYYVVGAIASDRGSG